MKSLKSVIVGLILIFACWAMVLISVNVRFGTSQVFDQAEDKSVRNYYLPNVGSNYDVQTSHIINMMGNSWIHSSNLPVRYNNYDLYSEQRE
jgi:hypothetical protein